MTFPGSPRLLKGAIVRIDPFNSLSSKIIFQYNPENLTRTLTAQTTGSDDASRGEVMRLNGPPQEAIKVEIVLDAIDQLERGTPPATVLGIHPALAALELLLYPKSGLIIANEVLTRIGVIEIIPPEVPLTLFVWGEKRVLPVRITEFSITEEAFDPNLNPIRAKVSLGMTVLSYHNLGLTSVGGALFMAHQILKETMATLNSATGSVTPGISANATMSGAGGA